MRHAKSDWADANQTDFDRGLNARGKKDAPKMCSIIDHIKDEPQHFFISTAKRARKTIDPIFSTISSKITFSDKLYSFTGSDYIRFIQEVPEQYNSIFLLGHNPSIEFLVSFLLNTDSGSIRVPTSSLIKMEIETDSWSVLKAGSGILNYFLHPKIVAKIT